MKNENIDEITYIKRSYVTIPTKLVTALPPAELKIYTMISATSNQLGYSTITSEWISTVTGLSSKTIVTSLKSLEEKLLIKRTRYYNKEHKRIIRRISIIKKNKNQENEGTI